MENLMRLMSIYKDYEDEFTIGNFYWSDVKKFSKLMDSVDYHRYDGRDDSRELIKMLADSDHTILASCRQGKEIVGYGHITVDLVQGNGQVSGCWYPNKNKEYVIVEGIKVLVNFGFDELGLHRLSFIHRASHHKSFELFSAAGFEEEGRLRQFFHYDGIPEDAIFMSILKDTRLEE